MRRSFFNRKIPTLFAIVLLVGGLGFASYLANTTLKLTSFASPDETPQDLRITNITDKGFTVTYTTTKAVLGTISYGTTTPTDTALDDRDKKTSSPKNYTVHAISVTGLKEKTKYVFSITSGGSTFLNNNSPFTVSTGPTLPSFAASGKTITGSILSLDGQKAADVLVYLTTANSQILSALTNGQGAYTFPLTGMRSKNLDSLLVLSDDTKMSLIAKTNAASSQATFLLFDPSVPQVTLSENYDFTLGREILLPSPGEGSENQSFPVFEGKPTENTTVSIASPKTDETFSDTQPEFTGTAAPSQEVQVKVQSEEQKATVTTDVNGSWSYRPQTPLAPGQHTITITSRDANGILRQISRNFIVLAEGSQFTEPSVSPGPKVSTSPTPTAAALTPTLTLTNTPTPPAVETPTPTLMLSPTEAIVLLPTSSPLPTITPRPTVQPTGSNDLNVIGLISFTFVTLGAILLLFTRGISL